MSSPVGEDIFIKKIRENYKFAEKCFQSVHITYDYRIIFAENQLRPADNKDRKMRFRQVYEGEVNFILSGEEGFFLKKIRKITNSPKNVFNPSILHMTATSFYRNSTESGSVSAIT